MDISSGTRPDPETGSGFGERSTLIRGGSRRFLLAAAALRGWAKKMAADRPYQSVAALDQAADRAWREAAREDWLEAFAAHPRIGQKSASQWAQQEQAGAAAEPRWPNSTARYANTNIRLHIHCLRHR